MSCWCAVPIEADRGRVGNVEVSGGTNEDESVDRGVVEVVTTGVVALDVTDSSMPKLEAQMIRSNQKKRTQKNNRNGLT